MRHAVSVVLLCAVFVGAAGADECRQPLYLTFDVGNMRHAEHIAGVLRGERVKATFFLANNVTARGDRALDPAWREYWQQRVREGHAFGNHTWSHLYARGVRGQQLVVTDRSGRRRLLSQQQFCHELTRVDEAFVHLTGSHLAPFWRAPGGRVNDTSLRWAASCGYRRHVGWSAAGLIGDELPSDRYPNDVLVTRAVQRLKSGDIMLLHLGIRSRQQPLAEALQPLIRGLKQKGFCFATVGASKP
jgi:peptidoglycan/xylan/chitin deacetylase (PgdA/CDA1 family)